MKLTQSAHQLLLPYVRSVLGSPVDGNAEFIGSGFLFKNKDELFFITAAHVMDKQTNDFQLFVDRPDEGLVRIYGNGIVSTSMKSDRSDDQIDISVVKLDNETSCKLSKTRHLTLESFDIDCNLTYKNGFICIGFPVSKNKGNVIRSNKEAVPYCIIVNESQETEYNALGLDKSNNILLDFNTKQAFSENMQHMTAGSLRGLSGAPVWGITETGKCSVVSLLIEHRNGKTVVTSKLGGILKLCC